ncbi:uncharacterized protein CCR75_008948 [Bremia lactucae]|uniref:RING-type E3 ubiquitin transferase n=1 Tax=Bremia lactucae TaxID=4779 RepID=A0A976FQV3_BRELC|nr:hypothetical protein CCR75_008948 [Bremia lactucae]
MALTRSRASTTPTALPAPPLASLSIPIRFQCPLCLDVLRHPIQLPCCHRYLCMECFERALELTSVNCGFCRRRVVGFARTKQYKVDEVMWNAIQSECPFLGDMVDDREPLVDFFDENAPRLHSSSENRLDTHNESTGALKAFYDQQLREHQYQVHEAEQRALEQTIEFLQNDLEFTASFSSPPASSAFSPVSSTVSSASSLPEPKMATDSIVTSRARHRPVTRSALNAVNESQPKLDTFFSSTRATSSHAGQSLHGVHSTSSGLSPPRVRKHLEISQPHRKYFLRSASHSPTPIKVRRRQAIKGRKTLRQLTLGTTVSPIALHTRSRDLKQVSARLSEPTKMLTRQRQQRSSWKCAHCTYTNTCFDSRCSMCRRLTSFTSLSF